MQPNLTIAVLYSHHLMKNLSLTLSFLSNNKRERTWTPTTSSLGGRMTSFSSSGISQGSSNSGSFITNQDPHNQQQNYNTPLRVHFTDGSTAGSNLGSTREGILKVI